MSGVLKDPSQPIHVVGVGLGCTYTVDLLNPQIFGKNDLYIDYCLFLNPFYVFLFVIIFVESHLTSDCF